MKIPKSIQKRITNQKWYHQRFDGSPMFLFAVGEAETKKEKRKPTRTEADIRVCYFEAGKADWYLNMTDINRGAKIIIDLARKDPNISARLLKAWEKDEKRFEDFFWNEFPKIKLSRLSDKELLDLWERYHNLFIARFTSSAIIDHFALGTDELIEKMLRQEVGKVKKESAFTEIFSKATAPVHQSFINEAEIDLLKIATGQSQVTLGEYQKKYFWTKNNYIVGQVLTIKHFEKEIKAWKMSGKDLRRELKRVEETPKRNKQEKEELFKKYQFSQLLRTLLKISEDFTWWQDERKKSTFLNIHVGSQILKIIGRRKGYKLEELKFAVAPEIPNILKNKKPNPQVLRARLKGSVFIMTREGYFVETGREVVKVKKIMLGTQKVDQVDDVRGLSASTGRAVGTAKIIKSVTEMNKVQPGDILIAVMTRPDYVPAMKRAVAIVTDEGGITCHAAIVSRELGIPCIIGTKIATQVFKDGQKVEVNANHGWVRKL